MPDLRRALPALTLLFLIAAGRPAAGAPQEIRADELLERALRAMGGEQKLRALHRYQATGVAHSYMLEQSERPEGPYLVSYQEFEEYRDLDTGRIEQTRRDRSIVMPPNGFERTVVVADGVTATRFGDRAGPGQGDRLIEGEDSLALGAERVLLTASASASLAYDGAHELQGIVHDVLRFDWNGAPVRVFLNRYTALPTAVEWVRDYPDGMWAAWGDVTTRIEYSLWHLEDGGLMMPHQITESRNGLPYRDATLLSFEANPEPLANPLEITDELRAAAEGTKARRPDLVELGLDFRGTKHEPTELAPGILQIRGMWNVALIEVDEGIVVLESPLSSAYSAKVIEETERRFPGRPIVGVISTSDAWPHHAGVREYVARDIPVHAFALTIPLLTRFVEAPRTVRPDHQSRVQAAPRFVAVDAATELGTGVNHLRILPIRGEGGERMLAVYFPEHRLLYASDLIQRNEPQPGFFMASYLAEVEALVEREAIDVDTVFAMHLEPRPWSEITDWLGEVRGRD